MRSCKIYNNTEVKKTFFQNGKWPQRVRSLGVLVLLACCIVNMVPVSTEAAAAAVPGSVPVSDILNVTSHTTNTANTTKFNIKKFLLDGLARMAAQILIQKITASIVQWINTGFQDGPAFLTDPEQFFLDAGDQVSGAFINGVGLNFLCSPFELNIRLGLALLQARKTAQRYKCTLTGVLKNVQNFQAFVKGDFFAGGGWDGWLKMTQSQQNNAYGAAIIAQQELSIKVGEKKFDLLEQFKWSKGFKDGKECEETELSQSAQQDVRIRDAANNLQAGNEDEADAIGQVRQKYDDRVKSNEKDPNRQVCKKYKTTTPGSVVQGQLDQVLPKQLEGLNVVDEINEIVGALANQLITQAVGQGSGLLGASEKNRSRGPGKDPTSLLDDIRDDGNARIVLNAKRQITENIDKDVTVLSSPTYSTKREKLISDIEAFMPAVRGYYSCLQVRLSPTFTPPPKPQVRTRLQGYLEGITQFYGDAISASSSAQTELLEASTTIPTSRLARALAIQNKIILAQQQPDIALRNASTTEAAELYGEYSGDYPPYANTNPDKDVDSFATTLKKTIADVTTKTAKYCGNFDIPDAPDVDDNPPTLP